MDYVSQRNTFHTCLQMKMFKGCAAALFAGDEKRETITPSLRGAVNG